MIHDNVDDLIFDLRREGQIEIEEAVTNKASAYTSGCFGGSTIEK
jgi:hypothetical protein